MTAGDIVEVRIGCPERQIAEEISKELLASRLAAAVHVQPAYETRFHWQGTVAAGTEFTVAARTRRCLFDAVAEVAAALHPYQVPAIVAVTLDPVTSDYREWLLAQTRAPARASG